MSLSARQVVEYFHLVFLRGLLARGEDKTLFALKGGCNLRFFFGSVRYSEDIDLDVRVTTRATLKNKVDRLLESPLVLAPLRAKAISVVEVSAPKQTETTQRWKLGLQLPGAAPLRTKVEFSRRDATEGAAFEGVSAQVLKPYGLTPMLATHYAPAAAVMQKVSALAGRPEPQARDVFDLNLLFARPDVDGLTAPSKLVDAAVEQAMAISFDHYTAQVVAFLEPDHAPLYSSRDAWNVMQSTVIERLEELSK